MQHPTGTRILALIVGLTVAASAPAFAQDTTETGQATIDTTTPDLDAIEADTAAADTTAADTTAADTMTADTAAGARDTTDTSGVQNPQGFRGMERDTTIFPDSAGPPVGADAVEDQTTGTYGDSAWQDTTGAAQNPAGYRGMERPADSAGVVDTVGAADNAEAADEAQPTEEVDAADHAEGADHSEATDTTRVGDTEPMEQDAATPRLDPDESLTGADTASQTPDSTQ